MRIRLGEKLHAASVIELLQLGKHLGCVHLQLLDTYTREREGYLEGLAMLLNHFAKGIEGGHVATLGDIGDIALVLVVIIVIMVGTDIKEAVSLKMRNLMYFEI